MATNPISVAVVNQSDTVTDSEVQTVITALQQQVSLHLAPNWRVDAALTFVAKGAVPRPGSWRFLIMDVTDVPGDSGYHNADDQGPFARVFAKTAMDARQQWTVAASHELLEMLVNPNACLASFVPSDQTGNVGKYYDLEICDPVYPDELAYLIGSVSVSDFVLPTWFTPWLAQSDPNGASAQVDHAKRLDGPMKVARGATIAVSSTGRYSVDGLRGIANAANDRGQRLPSTMIFPRPGPI